MLVGKMEDGYVKGYMTIDYPGLLFTSIPYDKGWTAYVDGKKYEIDTVGNAFIALKLAAGELVIEFMYFPPGLKLGLILTFACWILFGFLCGRTQLQNRLEGAASGKRRRRSRSGEISDVEPSDIIEVSKDDERLPESVRNEAEPSTDDDYYKHVDEILKDVFDDDKK